MRRISKAVKEQIRQEAEALAERVKETGNHPDAFIIGEDESTVKVRCPWCREVHTHGKAGGDVEGSVVPHCWWLVGMPNYNIRWPKA